jgi:hypothetical protein
MMPLGKLALAMLCFAGQVNAQDLRDPTLPPAEARLASPAEDGKAGSPALAAMTIIVRDGRPYLAVGTRLYAQGEKLGQARVERITETEVWLREGKVLRKVLQFQGIERHNTDVPAKPGADRPFVPALNSKMKVDANNSK